MLHPRGLVGTTLYYWVVGTIDIARAMVGVALLSVLGIAAHILVLSPAFGVPQGLFLAALFGMASVIGLNITEKRRRDELENEVEEPAKAILVASSLYTGVLIAGIIAGAVAAMYVSPAAGLYAALLYPAAELAVTRSGYYGPAVFLTLLSLRVGMAVGANLPRFRQALHRPPSRGVLSRLFGPVLDHPKKGRRYSW